jgi:hypothetical protein
MAAPIHRIFDDCRGILDERTYPSGHGQRDAARHLAGITDDGAFERLATAGSLRGIMALLTGRGNAVQSPRPQAQASVPTAREASQCF